MKKYHRNSTPLIWAVPVLLALIPMSPYARTLRVPVGQEQPTIEVRASGRIEVGFSPEGSARNLVLKVIESAPAGSNIAMMAYALTAPDIVQALVDRQRGGVNVAVIADYKENLTGKAVGRAALNSLVLGGVKVRTISVYPIHHDKVIVAGSNVEWGSFNFTRAAETANSENATVAWDNPALAQVYLQHFRSRWDKGDDYKPSF